MSRSRDSQRRRAELMARSPYCHWCGRKLVYFRLKPRQKTPPNFATLDHVNSRNVHPDGRPAQGRLVLACPPCNEKRGALEVAVMPKEELWRRSGRPPQEMRQRSRDVNVLAAAIVAEATGGD
jgi:hypothetical protein